jgi:predicted small metal-binding protein
MESCATPTRVTGGTVDKEIRGKELGIADCDFVAHGSASEVVRQFVDHLRGEHEIDMPDAKKILEDAVSEDDVDEGRISRGAWIVTQRLQDKLDIVPKIPQESWPPTEWLAGRREG